jgi:chitin synthase
LRDDDSEGGPTYLPGRYNQNNNTNMIEPDGPYSRGGMSVGGSTINSSRGSVSANSGSAASSYGSGYNEPGGYVMPPSSSPAQHAMNSNASALSSSSSRRFGGSIPAGNGSEYDMSGDGNSVGQSTWRTEMTPGGGGGSHMQRSFGGGSVASGNMGSASHNLMGGSQANAIPPALMIGSAHSAPGGSYNSNNGGSVGGGGGGVSGNGSYNNNSQYFGGGSVSRSYHSHPPQESGGYFGGGDGGGSSYGGSAGSGPMYQGSLPGSQYHVVPQFPSGGGMGMGDSYSYDSRARSLTSGGSRMLVPKARFSWASESLGGNSTVMTRRSITSASVPEPSEQRESKATEGRLWASFAWIITFPIPNKCIMRPTKDAKQAWREKVALFLIMISCSVFFVGAFGFVPLLLCKEDTIFSMQDVWLQNGESWVVVHGTIYDVKDLIEKHPGGSKGIVDYLGKDASKVFPRAAPATLPGKCLDMAKVEAYKLNVYRPDNNFTNPTCQSFTDLDKLLGITCHTFAAGSNGTAKFLGDYQRGILSHTTVGLNSEGLQWFALYDRVYDVTNYIKMINENRDPKADSEEESLDNNPGAYLTPTMNKVIMNSLGGDGTDLYENLFGTTEYVACFEEMFYNGILDDSVDTFCYTLNIMMYTMLIFVAALMVIQFLASLLYICPRHRTYSEEDVMSPVMVMVPCYNEGDNELRKTIKSVLNTTYPDENKVLLMVADGLVTGNGEDMSTPEHLANILGFDIDEFEDDTFEYDCIGVVHTKNRARVYHGILQKGHKFLKYIAVVKCGLPEEATTSAKPGNRGKRDSQLVIMGYYNRIHYGRELTELDSAIQRAMVDLNLQADMVRFLMAIDADTRVDTMSITHMVYGMDKKEKVLALCGETKVDNKTSSWVTMIQVFEYYNSHHLKKAFEAAFGCVTCLPGCFTMYRIIADDGTPLLPGDGVLYEYSRNDIETLHEKNLYHLGEDRMLTTLLLKYYPDRSLTFIPEATCWTIVPHTFRILLSQRRRWINSTVHNMFELLKVNTMCGVCCVSMKVVVFIDLIATMILPASYCYAMYLIFLVVVEDLPVSKILLILYGIIMGVQVVVFILRSRWEYVWWFSVYFVVGLPVFYLILPVYSFWNMDDFSWGKTRAVGGSAANNALSEGTDDDDETDEGDERGGLLKEGDDDESSTSSSSRTSSQDYEDEDGSDYDNESQDHSDYDNETEDGDYDEDGDDNDDDESYYSEEYSESQYDSQASGMQEQSYRSRTML